MTRIVQFSTIGALMAGHLEGEEQFSKVCCGCNFGLGCSADMDGELTIYNGQAYEATAGQSLETLNFAEKVPFIQITAFKPEQRHDVENIDHTNIEACLTRFIQPKNIFLAVSVEGIFDKITIRRPHRAEEGQTRSVSQIAAAQQVDTHHQIQGRLIGFWTPELFGRVSVPGFHFHFLDQQKQISGHVLEFSIKKAQLSFEEKTTLEVTNPKSNSYKDMNIDVTMLDEMIHKVEK